MPSNPCGGVEIKEIVKTIGVSGARWIEENVDPQFQALRFLYKHIRDREQFIPLVVANALVSYQLSGTGEEWWWEFTRWFSDHDIENVVSAYREFLLQSKTNRRLTNMKIRRLEKVEPFLEDIDIVTYYTDMAKLRNDLAEVLGANRNAKTIVFAVKMFGYAVRIITNVFKPYPMEIPIPVDSRIERFTKRLTEDDPIRFWNRVAKETGVPPLHIDSILWPVLSGDPEVREKIVQRFGKTGKELVTLLSLSV